MKFCSAQSEDPMPVWTALSTRSNSLFGAPIYVFLNEEMYMAIQLFNQEM